jgi:hypothetical protein
LISKSFQGSQGKAYLFNSVVNIICGPAEERVLLTGLHAVADIQVEKGRTEGKGAGGGLQGFQSTQYIPFSKLKCECCKTTLGWKYVSMEGIANPSINILYIGTCI